MPSIAAFSVIIGVLITMMYGQASREPQDVMIFNGSDHSVPLFTYGIRVGLIGIKPILTASLPVGETLRRFLPYYWSEAQSPWYARHDTVTSQFNKTIGMYSSGSRATQFAYLSKCVQRLDPLTGAVIGIVGK